MIPIGRMGKPHEVASVVEMLVTNAYLTNKVRVKFFFLDAAPSVSARFFEIFNFTLLLQIMVVDGGVTPSAF
jgi:hypothetical protein